MDKISPDIELRPYSPSLQREWDEFAARSRNATFLHQRPYMDYHADRFTDCSLMAYASGKLVALLPCCHIPGDGVSSHAGLTYGGWLLPPAHMDGTRMLAIFRHWLVYLRACGIKRAVYKPVPYIFCRQPSQEDLFALHACGFSLTRRLLSSTVDLSSAWKMDMSKRQQVRKALKSDARFCESRDLDGFYALLCECLASRHDARPVHTLPELKLLCSRFPENIRLHAALTPDGEIQAAVLIYYTGLTAHSQYACTTPYGRAHYLLTALYHNLMTQTYAHCRYFDFGTSNDPDTDALDPGLLAQKAALGATGVCFDTYSLTLD